MPSCDLCKKSFVSNTTLKRHITAFHEKKRITYQCCHCYTSYVRKENVLKHTQHKHGDNEGKFIISETTNKLYSPGIFKPATWTPPPEARCKPTIYRIKIPPSNTKNASKSMSTLLEEYKILQQQLLSETREPAWQPLTTKTLDEHNAKVTTETLMKDLYLSDSDTSISSNETVCLDELSLTPQLKNNEPVHIYNAFKN